MVDYRGEIEEYNRVLKAFRKSAELFRKEKELLELCQERYRLIYTQIHKVLAPKRTESGEAEIREHVKNVFALDLPVCESKVKIFTDALKGFEKKGDKVKVDLCYRYLQEWLTLYEDFYALLAFRSLEHFALFMEWDRSDRDKFWKYSIDTFNDGGYTGCMKGFFFYANQMVLNNNIKFILKQLPTSFGKSLSDSVMIAFIFGYNRDEQVIKVVGNPSLPSKCTKQVVEIMTKPRYWKVFPEYQKYIDESKKDVSSQIFSICRIKEGILTINGSSRDTSYECFSKDTDRDGIRGGYLFLDDIVQRSERMKIERHNKDLDAFDGTWKKRAKDERDFRIVCGGTTYDIYDLLETLKFRYSKGKLKRSQINKYTTLSMDEDAVFIKVPKLDEKDNLTFPQKTVLSNVLADRKNNPELFKAMDMQEPVAPEENPFYWDYLRQFEYIPDSAKDYCLATLDPARTGDNYVSMPVFRPVEEIDKDGTKVERYYLVDCLYIKAPMEDCYNKICDLIERNHIINLHVERNTDTSLKFLIEKLLKERNINFCEISEVYSTKVKEDRIYANERLIKNMIVFPCRDMYGRASQMGTFEEQIVSYAYKGSAYDDSIDAVSLFVDKFINLKQKNTKAKLLYV